MNTREQFGNYLLLKKLGEDPLGEAFRAGRVGGQGMEEVVLLRVFNGPGIDGPGMWQRVDGRQALQSALTSPNIGNGVDLGAIRNIPYVAYDYLSGKNLANLLEQASKRANPIPSDHALLIAERIALGLAVGYETRFGGDRVLHGCVVPNLVIISNEGETRLLGFEVAPGLREAIRQNPSHALGRYLSPEARAGHPTDKADDVFSLGVILLELLSGQPVPANADYGSLIGNARMQPDGTPVPDGIKQLLASSLAAKEHRVGDVIQWHKTLSKLMFDGQYNPTTFNLAFYMHNLFREEIEKESKEIEVERTMEIPVTSLPTAAADATPTGATPAPQGDLRETTGVREDTGVIMDRYSDQEEKSGLSKGLLAAIAAVLMIAVGAGAYLMMGRDTAPADTEATTTSEPAPAEPAGPTPEELEAQAQAEAEEAAAEERAQLEEQIQSILDEKTKERDAELEALRADLAAAQSREAEAQKERERLAAEAQAAADAEAERLAAEQAEAERLAAEQAAEEEAAAQAALEAEQAKEEEAQMAQKAPAPPPEPEVKTGDLVTLGPGVVPPKFITMRPVTYPAMARRLRKESTVTVSCLVDETGNVRETRLKGREVGFGMDSEALAAAKTARFNPATKNGVRVRIWWDLPIKFQL